MQGRSRFHARGFYHGPVATPCPNEEPALSLRFLLIVLAALACLTSSAAAQDSRVDLSLVWQRNAVDPGSETLLAIVLDIDEGWHLYPGAGSADEVAGYIATSLNLTLPEGITAGEPIWPSAKDFLFGIPGYQEELKVYEGRAMVLVPVRTADSMPEGDATIGVEVGYQACDDSICEEPTSVTGEASLRIGAADEGVEPKRATIDLPGDLPAVAPGGRIAVPISLSIEPGWHIWPGESTGEPAMYPTVLRVQTPHGWAQSTPRWPESHIIRFGTADFAEELPVYEGESTILVGLLVPEETPEGTYDIAALLEYQPCDDEVCEMIQFAVASGTVRVDASAEESGDQANMDALFAGTALPTPSVAPSGEAKSGEATSGGLSHLHLWLTLGFVIIAGVLLVGKTFLITGKPAYRILAIVSSAALIGLTWVFVEGLTRPSEIRWQTFSRAAFDEARASGAQTVVVEFTADWCFNCKVLEVTTLADPAVVEALNDESVIAFQVDLTGTNEEGEQLKEELGGGGIPLTAVFRPGSEKAETLRSHYPPSAILAALGDHVVAEAGEGSHEFDFLGWKFSVSSAAWPLILGIAAVAGFLMNFTPCVLPVIPLKILSLQAHARNPAKCFALGVIFGLGIVAFFAFLGLLMAGLLGVTPIDWGQMWSSPWLSGGMGLFILAMGLGMLGLFVIQLPQAVYLFNPQSDTYTGSFFMGVFAAVLSTPCTGPLLGATIAWVAGQGPLLAFATLVVMGVGMAAPYVVLTARPALLEKLPRSGPGSELIKQVMGVLLIAIATYFLGISALAFGISA